MRRFLVLVVILLIDHSIDAQQLDAAVPCVTDRDCSVLAKNQKDPTCRGGFCVCLNEQQKLMNCSSLIGIKQEKADASQFYHPCKLDTDCSFNNSFCNLTWSQCSCLRGYVLSLEKQQCLKVAQGLTSSCLDDKQCLGFQSNTTCVGNQCICVTGFHTVENICWPTVAFGSPCTRSEECNHINGAICTDKKVCGCNDKMLIDNFKRNCVLLAETIGDYCTSDDHCSAIRDSICVDAKCQCPKKKHYVETLKKCIINRDIDEPCQHDYECYQIENGTSSTISTLQCVGSLCDCGDNYLRQSDKCVSAGVPTSHFSLLITLSTVIWALLLQ